jgi:exodeoxyribonuclease V alpha subunit
MTAQVTWSALGALGTLVERPAKDQSAAAFLDALQVRVVERGGDQTAVHTADELALLADPGRGLTWQALVLLHCALAAAMVDGSTRLCVKGKATPLDAFLDAAEANSAQRGKVAALVKGGGGVGRAGEAQPLVVDGAHLYTHRMRELEVRGAASLQALLAAPAPRDTSRALAAVEKPTVHLGERRQLGEDQRAALRTALGHAVALVTGGPGTGKTFLIFSVLRVLARLKGFDPARVVLAAPTGKAADRMRQSVSQLLESMEPREPGEEVLRASFPETLTLHRLLAWSPSQNRFLKGPDRPVAYSHVIVDEASMLDSSLFGALVSALPQGCHLLMLGDADQLPSVAAGAVFRDLMECLGSRVARLTHNHRVSATLPGDASLLDAACAVNAGQANLAPLFTHPSSVADLRWRGAEWLVPVPGNTTALLEALFRRALGAEWKGWTAEPLVMTEERQLKDQDQARLGALLAHHRRHRILCVLRDGRGLSTAEGINLWMRRRLDRKASTAFLPGEPVMVTRNDYGRRLFNGDSGVVVSVRDEAGTQALMAAFPADKGHALFAVEEVASLLVPAWAMTVHKAQGSEFDHVTVILPDADNRVLSRQLLYTALTRARQGALLFSSVDAVARAVERVASPDCGLAQRVTGQSA